MMIVSPDWNECPVEKMCNASSSSPILCFSNYNHLHCGSGIIIGRTTATTRQLNCEGRHKERDISWNHHHRKLLSSSLHIRKLFLRYSSHSINAANGHATLIVVYEGGKNALRPLFKTEGPEGRIKLLQLCLRTPTTEILAFLPM